MQYKTGLGLTPELKEEYERDYGAQMAQQQCDQCLQWRDWMLAYSPTVRFMVDRIANLNAEPTPAIKCEVCPDWKSGGFHPGLGILLCANRTINKWHLEDTLAHELVHAYDNTRFDVNWLDLKHHACSEIRASSLSGECRFWREFQRRGFGFTVAKGHQECVKRRATLSVQANPKCPDEQTAKRVVNEVWDSCFRDTRPFDEIYR